MLPVVFAATLAMVFVGLALENEDPSESSPSDGKQNRTLLRSLSRRLSRKGSSLDDQDTQQPTIEERQILFRGFSGSLGLCSMRQPRVQRMQSCPVPVQTGNSEKQQFDLSAMD
jgi:hypothetical protein